MADIKYTDLSGLEHFSGTIKSILDDKANISSLGSYYTKAQVDNLLGGKSDSGHGHSYLPLSGGALTGSLDIPGNRYASLNLYGINLNNSDIVGLNSVYFADSAQDAHEGLNFARTNGNWDIISSYEGTPYYYPNCPLDTTSWDNAKVILHSGNYTTYCTPGNIGAALASHGNHIPAPQTASNKVFLRNDNTWQTITPANIGALALSGGIMTGNISYGNNGSTVYEMIRFINGNTDGCGIAIGGGGTTLIGGGESATVVQSALITSGNEERMIISNDQAIDFYTYCQSGSLTNAKHFSFGIDGNIYCGSTAVSLNGHNHDSRYYTESEIDTKLAGKSDTHNHNYLPLAGGILTGNLVISKGSTADVSYTSGNASIEFNSGEQPVKLMYSHYDSYRSPAGLKVIGDQADCWFEADGNIYGKSFYKKDGTEVSYTGHTHGYWTWNENTIKNVKVNSATSADSAGRANYLTCHHLNYDQLNNLGDSFLYYGSIETGSDTQGIQIGSGVTKMQLESPLSTQLRFRTNDTGGTDSANWGAWNDILHSNNYTSYCATAGHNHNTSYYTKTEVDNKLAGKSDTHNHNYLPLAGGTMNLGEGLKFHSDDNYFGTNLDARIISLLDGNDTTCDGGLIIDERCMLNGTEHITELLRIRHSEFKWKGTNISLDGHTHTKSQITDFPTSMPASDVHAWAKKSSLAASDLPSHTHSYLPLAGGIMDSGKGITFQGSGGISYKGTQQTYQMIGFLNNAANTYGNGIRIGGGGTVIIGAGESSTSFIDAGLITDYNDEILHLMADGAINFYSCCDTIGNRKTMTFGSDGVLKVGNTAVSLDGHNHDGRYYTESEIDTKLAGKSDTHSHNYLPLTGGSLSGPITFTTTNGLSYKGSVSTYSMIQFINNASDGNGNGIKIGGGGATLIGGGESADQTATLLASGGDERMIISNDQSIDFYTYCQNGLGSAKNFVMNTSGQMLAPGGFFQSSDERLKDFQDDIQVDFEKLSKLRKKYFTWKSEEDKKLQIGVSAQEIQEIYPELVTENNEGTLTVAYDKLSVIALKAIDELDERLKRIEKLLNI